MRVQKNWWIAGAARRVQGTSLARKASTNAMIDLGPGPGDLGVLKMDRENRERRLHFSKDSEGPRVSCHSPIPTCSASFSVPYWKYYAYTGTMSLRGGVFFHIWFAEELHACKASISSISFACAACRARAANLTQDTWFNTTLQTFPHSYFSSACSYFCS